MPSIPLRCIPCNPSTIVPIIGNYVKCFPCNGRSPFAPPPSSRQCNYHLEDSFTNPKQQIESSVPKFPCACSPYPAFFSGKFSGRLCTSAPRTAVFQSEKNSICPSFPLPRFQHHQAFFSFPPYRCLSLRLRSVIHRKSQRFPMFLQHIAVIPFSDALHPFIPAVYAFPSPRAAVCHCTVPAQHHTAAFPIPFPQRVPRNPRSSRKHTSTLNHLRLQTMYASQTLHPLQFHKTTFPEISNYIFPNTSASNLP